MSQLDRPVKSKDPATTIERLREVREVILVEPERFVMARYFDDPTKRHGLDVEVDQPPDYDLFEPGCGTACCIAGWAIALEARREGETAQNLVNRLGKGYCTWAAADVLRLDRYGAERLFSVANWPAPERKQYCDGDAAEAAAEAAAAGAAVIDLWIEALQREVS